MGTLIALLSRAVSVHSSSFSSGSAEMREARVQSVILRDLRSLGLRSDSPGDVREWTPLKIWPNERDELVSELSEWVISITYDI